jgi:aminoglycoside 3-N-acetyltransferase
MVTKEQLKLSLQGAGLARGDTVVVHSSLRSVGPIDGGADALIDALLEIVGADGVVAMPTFGLARTLSDPIFDPATTRSETGILSEVFRKRPQVHRSLHPTHSVAVLGPGAAEVVAGHLDVECNGLGSPLDKLALAGGKVLLIGVSHTANTTVHVGEAHAGVEKVPNWFPGEPPRVRLRMPDGSVIEHPLDVSASCSFAFNAVDLPLRARGQVTDLVLGGAVSHLMSGRDVIDATVEVCRAHPDVLLCTRSVCRRCTMTRQRLARHRH